MDNHAKATSREEALEYVLNRARNFLRVATIYNLTPATERALNELSEAVHALKPKREHIEV